MGKSKDLKGLRFGKLTVIERLTEQQDRYWLWRCRCDCGREISVNTKRLLRNTIKSCPDCEGERQTNRPLDLRGERYGRLTVISPADEKIQNRRTWNCLCDCGNGILATTHDLRKGKVKSCGCVKTEKNKLRYKDLTGQTFGQLTALVATDQRSTNGSVVWKCICSCGKECLKTEDALVNGSDVSCGCYRSTVLPLRLQEGLHRIDGTCVEHIKRKIRADNKSGYPGIYEQPDGRWKAYIGFKGKKYYLGIYTDKREALKARFVGEEMHDDFLNWYYNEYLPEQANKNEDDKESNKTGPFKLV